MFFKSSKKYSLNDIQKLFLRIPIIFIFLLAIVALLISFFIVDAKKNRKINLLQQKALLNYEFQKKEELQGFKNNVKKHLQNLFLNEEILLKKTTYIATGYLDSNSLEKIDLFLQYLKELEEKNGINLVRFSKNDLAIVYGKDTINYIQILIFNTEILQKNKDIVLQYIYSQGQNNLQYWKNDLKNSVRLSFFDKITIKDKEYFVGSFSTINSIREITKDAIIDTIDKKSYAIWFYDIIAKSTYNFDNNKTYVDGNFLINRDEKGISYKILKHYFYNYEYDKEFKNYTYMYDRYKFLTSSFYNEKVIEDEIKDLIFTIRIESEKLFFQIFSI